MWFFYILGPIKFGKHSSEYWKKFHIRYKCRPKLILDLRISTAPTAQFFICEYRLPLLHRMCSSKRIIGTNDSLMWFCSLQYWRLINDRLSNTVKKINPHKKRKVCFLNFHLIRVRSPVQWITMLTKNVLKVWHSLHSTGLSDPHRAAGGWPLSLPGETPIFDGPVGLSSLEWGLTKISSKISRNVTFHPMTSIPWF